MLYVILRQVILLSNALEECKDTYQVGGPASCKNTKFVTKVCWVELLNFNIFQLTNCISFVLDIESCSFAEGIGSVVILNSW